MCERVSLKTKNHILSNFDCSAVQAARGGHQGPALHGQQQCRVAAAYRHLHGSLYRSVNLLAGPRMGCGASNAAPVPGQANTLNTKSVAVRTELVVPDSDTDEELLSATPGQFESCTLWVGMVPSSIANEGSLATILTKKFGPVISIVPRSKPDITSDDWPYRSWAFVTFGRRSHKEAALGGRRRLAAAGTNMLLDYVEIDPDVVGRCGYLVTCPQALQSARVSKSPQPHCCTGGSTGRMFEIWHAAKNKALDRLDRLGFEKAAAAAIASHQLEPEAVSSVCLRSSPSPRRSRRSTHLCLPNPTRTPPTCAGWSAGRGAGQ